MMWNGLCVQDKARMRYAQASVALERYVEAVHNLALTLLLGPDSTQID